MGISWDNVRGLVLALSSSVFIGSSFIVKKKGLKRAGANGVRAGSGGFSYLYEPLWWVGMITMIVGEIANFAAYAFAPAILVTPLGALSIIVSAVLAHFILEEKLHIFAVLGCVLCVVGSTTIVLHAPQERAMESVKEVWHLATEPGQVKTYMIRISFGKGHELDLLILYRISFGSDRGLTFECSGFIVYTCVVSIVVLVLIFRFVPHYGKTHLLVYIGICSLMGSLTVMSVKALGIALKLTFSGMNQFKYFQTWIFTMVVVVCCLLQLNYLNKKPGIFLTYPPGFTGTQHCPDIGIGHDNGEKFTFVDGNNDGFNAHQVQFRETEQQQASRYKNGLTKKLQEKIALQPAYSLSKIVQLAKQASELQAQHRPLAPAPTMTALAISTITAPRTYVLGNCYGSGKLGHQKRDCLAFAKKVGLVVDGMWESVIATIQRVLQDENEDEDGIHTTFDWDTQDASQISTELCGFVTILSGTFLLHKTKDMGNKVSTTELTTTNTNSNLITDSSSNSR
ncbi:hypothetical protein GIB67_028972 [Kingdonia uniflora]|uniref:Probable magnesium transporter n=1 Tax=Kingdonia uniflora TaxID=39325 RepID=A0A7J7LBX2_9MAGN|nr:hypothetical protein GIB67_028972 [Kingdonia uniflora]